MKDKSFIEMQFPISKLSAESYKERKANLGQTLTRLGKWWGRKPLVLIRASIIGMIMPASSNPKKDREIFLKILTMDSGGLWNRRKAEFSDADLLLEAPEFKKVWNESKKDEREELREAIWETLPDEAKKRLDEKRKFQFTKQAFEKLPYDQKIKNCWRPEHIEGPDAATWVEINKHLKTKASNIAELIEELGTKTFGHRPKVGDSFCGGGSIPFEAARLGCDSFGNDLNPVAALLTWGSLNLIGGGKEVQERVYNAQVEAFSKADKQIAEWGIEHNELGWRADAFLYCVEVKVPGSKYPIPLAPTWIIGERSKVIARLKCIPGQSLLDIEIVTNPSDKDWACAALGAKSAGTGTVRDGRIIDPFDRSLSWSIEELRGAQGLRLWDKQDFIPRPDDVFQERLYCIRWVKPDGTKVFLAPDAKDLEREKKVYQLLMEQKENWWAEGVIPSRMLPTDGQKTDEPIRTRGWTHWHHLFTPRQLLVNGILSESMKSEVQEIDSARMLAVHRCTDWNSRLCAWMHHGGNEKGNQVFTNQALNTLCNYSTRPLKKLQTSWFLFDKGYSAPQIHVGAVSASDARDSNVKCDMWITDPPYADAINYHELADFFLAWTEKGIAKNFPAWVPDSRAALAVKGTGEDFKRSMVDIYSNLVKHMPDNGLQMVQFTHQDPSVWADLGMILWAAGLRVSAAWTVATETPASGLKKGNYVQGTVLLVLRKRLSHEDGFLDEVYPAVEDEVRSQIDSMRDIDDGTEPNFGDSDYQLAAYAAALRVLTQYQTLDGQEVGHELFRDKQAQNDLKETKPRKTTKSEKSRFEKVIERGIEIACSYLTPKGLENVWQGLSADERLYLRSLDVESRGERRQGVYQELARGFGVKEVKSIILSDKANGTRVKTASDFRNKDLTGEGFGGTKLRQLLFAIFTVASNEDVEAGVGFLKEELVDYWNLRLRYVEVLDWLVNLGQVEEMTHWTSDSQACRLLAGRMRSDHG